MIYDYKGQKPVIHETCFVADDASIVGRVTLDQGANVWFGTVIRGDDNYVTIGKNTNVQDNSTIHIAKDFPTIIGDNVTIGHGSIVHACTLGDNILVGMGAIILNGAVVEDNVIIAAGSVVPPGKHIPSGVMVMGTPAKVVKELTQEQIDYFKTSADNYVQLANDYMNK